MASNSEQATSYTLQPISSNSKKILWKPPVDEEKALIKPGNYGTIMLSPVEKSERERKEMTSDEAFTIVLKGFGKAVMVVAAFAVVSVVSVLVLM